MLSVIPRACKSPNGFFARNQKTAGLSGGRFFVCEKQKRQCRLKNVRIKSKTTETEKYPQRIRTVFRRPQIS
ncbi:hypothetical protein HMPREF9120_00772 [Neisseria sp. oral taxon 020 str. F0370]|nr:hypothetical protein HMPREF9120_00772 [Neisseria sp. oral taxon 020 str. F0370]